MKKTDTIAFFLENIFVFVIFKTIHRVYLGNKDSSFKGKRVSEKGGNETKK